MTCKAICSALVAIVLGASAVTEATGQVVVTERARPSARQEGMVRVQLSIQMFIAGPTDESQEAEQQRERARRALYELAGKECDLMRAVMAQDCRLESVNVNLNRQHNPQVPQMQGYQVGGSMTYQITLK
jgi:hypothetical protein